MRGKKLNQETFIKKANEIHNNKFDYSKTVFRTVNEKVKIICPIHGEFEQFASGHIHGFGCKKCSFEEVSKKTRFTKKQFIEQSRKIHGDKYDYSLVDYKNSKTKVKIICPIHGEFEQNAGDHMRGWGCDKCRVLNITFTTEQFIEKSRKIHGNKYDYSLVDYKNSSETVKIICPIHGEFEQMAYSHMIGKGCSKCAMIESSQEEKIKQFLIDNNIKFKERDRTLIKPFELDFILPDHKIAIEVNGIIWHSEKFGKDKNYHLNKTKKCNERGYHLIHLYENEINDDFENITLKIFDIIFKKENFTESQIILDRDHYNFAPNGYQIIKEIEPEYTYTKSNNRITKREYDSLKNKRGWFKLWDTGKIICEKM